MSSEFGTCARQAPLHEPDLNLTRLPPLPPKFRRGKPLPNDAVLRHRTRNCGRDDGGGAGYSASVAVTIAGTRIESLKPMLRDRTGEGEAEGEARVHGVLRRNSAFTTATSTRPTLQHFASERCFGG